jgi:hypothetical protein
VLSQKIHEASSIARTGRLGSSFRPTMISVLVGLIIWRHAHFRPTAVVGDRD